jgi:hypothetical protein
MVRQHGVALHYQGFQLAEDPGRLKRVQTLTIPGQYLLRSIQAIAEFVPVCLNKKWSIPIICGALFLFWLIKPALYAPIVKGNIIGVIVSKSSAKKLTEKYLVFAILQAGNST